MTAPTAERQATTCLICDQATTFRWTDTHGVGACMTCGAPYRLYHYENEKRVDKPPETTIKPEFVEPLRRYWAEEKRNVCPGAFNFPGSSYEVASDEDFEAAAKWWEKHDADLPKGDK